MGSFAAQPTFIFQLHLDQSGVTPGKLIELLWTDASVTQQSLALLTYPISNRGFIELICDYASIRRWLDSIGAHNYAERNRH